VNLAISFSNVQHIATLNCWIFLSCIYTGASTTHMWLKYEFREQGVIPISPCVPTSPCTARRTLHVWRRSYVCNCAIILKNRTHVPCFCQVTWVRVEVWKNKKCCGNTWSLVITFRPSCRKLACKGFVYTHLSMNWLSYRLKLSRKI